MTSTVVVQTDAMFVQVARFRIERGEQHDLRPVSIHFGRWDCTEALSIPLEEMIAEPKAGTG
jgi:hypothetical protein